MHFPAFFQDIPLITLRDPLAAILGAATDGLIDYRYTDAVKLAGHSCPTVAGAWLMARRGLRALYGEDLPERGGLRVDFRAAREAGTTGVVGNVLGLITGAAGEEGFKGLGGRLSRRDLLRFAVELPAELRLTRLDSGAATLLDYHPERVPPAAEMAPLMARVVGGVADPWEQIEFARLWQDRVRRILLEHADDPELVVARSA
ncbi:MAG: hypothetical protein FJ209_11205 [Betaproteobacteria bacterium]|nr:hypothetical protein [Betaproteobacteria bacterium]